jgi:sister-chromatid-cohesion protein PDS5
MMENCLRTAKLRGFIVELTCSCIIQTHLRFEASLSFLKLVEHKKHRRLIDVRDFERMALVIQDTMYQVRKGLMDEIVSRLGKSNLVPSYYVVIIFLTAHEPEAELKNSAKTFLTKCCADAREKQLELSRAEEPDEDMEEDEEDKLQRQNDLVEYHLSRLVHMIAHHPDFGSTDPDDLDQAEHYFAFFLECVASADNVAYLYHCAQKLKQMRDVVVPEDGEAEEHNDGLYALCDLVQLLIREKSAAHGWSIPSYPSKVDFPKDLYAKLGNEDGSRVCMWSEEVIFC